MLTYRQYEKTFSDHSSEFVVECIEGFMEILKTPENAIIAISKYKLQSPDAIRTKGYGALSYECGCGESHDVNDINTKKYAAAPIIRLILFCPNKFFTMINIKGFFKQKCISEWACTKKVFDSAIYKLFPEWKKGGKEINNLTLFYKTGKL